jgi:hypothetical protein
MSSTRFLLKWLRNRLALPAALLGPFLWAGAIAAGAWLTIAGEPADGVGFYAQVRPAGIDVKGDMRMVPLRINLGPGPATVDGQAYRSVETDVQIDCTRQTARYLRAMFYARPDFQGDPFRAVNYGKDDLQPSLLAGAEEGTSPRIIRAACSAKSVTSN